MAQENLPVQTVKSLINACITSFLFALVILFVAVLPAEYGIDPTGLGRKMGLIMLSQADRKLSKASAENCIKPPHDLVQSKSQVEGISLGSNLHSLDSNKLIQWKDSVKIVIPPKKGLEYKFAMNKNEVLEYSWSTDGASIYFDFHGEPKGAKNGYFKSYLESSNNESKGHLTAPFEGIHGWYWENDNDQPIAIELKTNGDYQVLGIMK
jgi:hypothetical protein